MRKIVSELCLCVSLRSVSDKKKRVFGTTKLTVNGMEVSCDQIAQIEKYDLYVLAFELVYYES